MRIGQLFKPVESMDADEAREYISHHSSGSYTLLDVRQPGEYGEGHIPGARLIPLPHLSDASRELDPDKPVIAYCAVGGRSRVAAQLLSGMGFREIYNLKGGIQAWEGRKASGPQELNLGLVPEDATAEEAIKNTYGMETALQVFYERIMGTTEDSVLHDVLTMLQEVEERHKEMLRRLYEDLGKGPLLLAESDEASAGAMEGGFDVDELLKQNQAHIQEPRSLLELSMMLETQAMDLYLRMAQRARNEGAREVFLRISDEERKHLSLLGDQLDKHIRGGTASPRR